MVSFVDTFDDKPRDLMLQIYVPLQTSFCSSRPQVIMLFDHQMTGFVPEIGQLGWDLRPEIQQVNTAILMG